MDMSRQMVPTLSDDRATLLAMVERWQAEQKGLSTSRHNAMFHLETAIHRLDAYLSEFEGFDPERALTPDDLAHLPEDQPE